MRDIQVQIQYVFVLVFSGTAEVSKSMRLVSCYLRKCIHSSMPPNNSVINQRDLPVIVRVLLKKDEGVSGLVYSTVSFFLNDRVEMLKGVWVKFTLKN